MSIALITGASRGIGNATTKLFLENGWEVIGTSTSGEIDIDNPQFTPLKLDISKPESIAEFVKELKTRQVKLNVLVNNAGMRNDRESSKLDIHSLRQTFEVNVFGLGDLTTQLLELMNEDAKIIDISSSLGSFSEETPSFCPAYNISKAALNMYTRTLASYLKDTNSQIKVVSLDPGWVKTDMGGSGANREPIEPATDIWDLVNSDFESGLFYSEGKPRAW